MTIPYLSILVVDDDSTNLMMSSGIIESLGIKPDQADSGKKAIEMCGKKTYDVIFMDLEMPELDGYKTTQVIKSMNKGSQINSN